MPALRATLFVIFALAIAGALALRLTLFRPHLTAVERGRRLAEANGCFACHGPEGGHGTGNPGRPEKSVPSYKSLMMYAKDATEVREWIRDGVTAVRAKSESWRRDRDAGA